MFGLNQLDLLFSLLHVHRRASNVWRDNYQLQDDFFSAVGWSNDLIKGSALAVAVYMLATSGRVVGFVAVAASES